jgi:hypothetical protein
MMLKSTFWRVFISDNHDRLGVLGLERINMNHQQTPDLAEQGRNVRGRY